MFGGLVMTKNGLSACRGELVGVLVPVHRWDCYRVGTQWESIAGQGIPTAALEPSELMLHGLHPLEPGQFLYVGELNSQSLTLQVEAIRLVSLADLDAQSLERLECTTPAELADLFIPRQADRWLVECRIVRSARIQTLSRAKWAAGLLMQEVTEADIPFNMEDISEWSETELAAR